MGVERGRASSVVFLRVYASSRWWRVAARQVHGILFSMRINTQIDDRPGGPLKIDKTIYRHQLKVFTNQQLFLANIIDWTNIVYLLLEVGGIMQHRIGYLRIIMCAALNVTAT